MLKMILGAPGSGKSELLIQMMFDELKEYKSKNREIFILVPEQEVMNAERKISDRADEIGIAYENLQVVSFRRLADAAFRKYGGIEYDYIDEGGRLTLMWRIIEELAPALVAYSKSRDRAFVEMMLSACNEFRHYSITPGELELAADKIGEENKPLTEKLRDLALIYAAYMGYMSGVYADPADDVTRLANLLKSKPFLEGCIIFADSFNGFTVSELSVLEQAMRRCDLVIALNLGDGGIGSLTSEETRRDITEAALRQGVQISEPVIIESGRQNGPKEISLIRERLWDFSCEEKYDTESHNISLLCAENTFYEVEMCALEILEKVRDGARFRDFAVITRNADSYSGIIDAMFEKYGIPLFLSVRKTITETRFYRAIAGALDVIVSDWRSESVLAYIKTDMCDLGDEEINALEQYVTLWNISGARWTNDHDWSMNPEGYTDNMSEDDSRLLAKLNEIKIRVREPIMRLCESLSGGVNLESACTAIFEFMIRIGMPEKANSKEDVTLYNTIINLLDNLVRAAGDVPVNAAVFMWLFEMTASKNDYGKIPHSIDEVIFGDASLIRVSDIKHIILLGCENGNFPGKVTENSIFSDTDKSVLSGYGIKTSPDTEVKSDDEMFYFYRACCKANQTLTLSYRWKGEDGKENYPSIGYNRVAGFFPHNKVKRYPDGYGMLQRIQTEKTAQEHSAKLHKGAERKALARYFEEKGIASNIFSISHISETNEYVSGDKAKDFFGQDMNMTNSRLESYVKCPFSYYCKYLLKLDEPKNGEFAKRDIGVYIHRILEKAIKRMTDENGLRTDIEDSETEEIIDQAIHEVLGQMFGDGYISGARLNALLSRLRRTSILIVKNIIEEFRNSRFVPKYFELRIDRGKGGVEPYKVMLEDGSSISVYGVIDRVDTYKKGDDVYIRVVDYKTGSQSHSLKNIKLGLDLQMLLYLFAITESGDNNFIKDIGVGENGKVKAAGVLYQTATYPQINTDGLESTATISDKARAELTRSGAVINDAEILEAMEKNLAGLFIPVTEDKDGNLSGRSKLALVESFGELAAEIGDVLNRMGKKMKSGNACADPLQVGGKIPCSYCAMNVVCRREESSEDEENFTE